MGAGATAFCDLANPERRPPLAKEQDFQRMIKQPVPSSVWGSPDGKPMGAVLCEAIHIFNGNLEELFGALFGLELGDPDAGLSGAAQELRQLLSNAPKMPPTMHLQGQWLLSMTQGGLQTELAACLGTRGPQPAPHGAFLLSAQHLAIARALEPGDQVVTFNYDVVMQVAMLYAGKLGRGSFDNPSIREIWLSPRLGTDDPVAMITPHGFFSWFADEEFGSVAVVLGRDQQEVRHYLPPKFGGQAHGSTLVLPLAIKSRAFARYPILLHELIRFLNAVSVCDELHLIGKQFRTSDADVAELLAPICATSRRRLVYVNPEAADQAWRDHHNEIFNASDDPIAIANLAEYVEYLGKSA